MGAAGRNSREKSAMPSANYLRMRNTIIFHISLFLPCSETSGWTKPKKSFTCNFFLLRSSCPIFFHVHCQYVKNCTWFSRYNLKRDRDHNDDSSTNMPSHVTYCVCTFVVVVHFSGVCCWWLHCFCWCHCIVMQYQSKNSKIKHSFRIY